MIERIIENWLDKASEKAFQIPFCYILINQGHTIIHMTRHCGMEHGKDIISKDKDGNICAYQLKGAPGSKIKLRDWQQEILGQINQLVYTPITHPSVNDNNIHKSYFVTNGGIEEEVSHAINAYNVQQEKLNLPYRINTIVDWELKDMAKKLAFSFLPSDLKNFKTLLEFLLEDGKGCINKEKLASLLEAVLSNEEVSNAKFRERINSAALLISIATSNFINENNHFSVHESWMMYISYLYSYVSYHKIPKKDWEVEYLLGEQLAVNSLENLWDEVKNCKDFLVGDVFEDVFFHRSKGLLILGLVSNLGIYHMIRKSEFNYRELDSFVEKNLKNIEIWGESAMPYILSIYWYYKKRDAGMKPAFFLKNVIDNIVRVNKTDRGLASPYYNVEDCLIEQILHEEKIKYDKYHSYYIEGLINLFVIQNYKQQMKFMWPDITHFIFKQFNLQTPNDFFRWNNITGKEYAYLPKYKKEWSELKNESYESSGNDLPELIKNNPALYPLLLSVFPHRSSSSGIRWFNTKLNE